MPTRAPRDPSPVGRTVGRPTPSGPSTVLHPVSKRYVEPLWSLSRTPSCTGMDTGCPATVSTGTGGTATTTGGSTGRRPVVPRRTGRSPVSGSPWPTVLYGTRDTGTSCKRRFVFFCPVLLVHRHPLSETGTGRELPELLPASPQTRLLPHSVGRGTRCRRTRDTSQIGDRTEVQELGPGIPVLSESDTRGEIYD